MAIKKLSPELIDAVNGDIKNWLHHTAELNKHQVASPEWFKHIGKRNDYYQILKSITGLTDSRLNNMLYNDTNTATYWKPDGTIKRNY